MRHTKKERKKTINRNIPEEAQHWANFTNTFNDFKYIQRNKGNCV